MAHTAADVVVTHGGYPETQRVPPPNPSPALAVARTFNKTNEKHGFPHLLRAA